MRRAGLALTGKASLGFRGPLLPCDLAHSGVRDETDERMRFGGGVPSEERMGQEAVIPAGVQVKPEPKMGVQGSGSCRSCRVIGAKKYGSPRIGKRDLIPPSE